MPSKIPVAKFRNGKMAIPKSIVCTISFKQQIPYTLPSEIYQAGKPSPNQVSTAVK
jgi:hypothetical protein